MLALAREEADAPAGRRSGRSITLEPWRFHDLRRTAASGLARLGFPVHVIEAVLNHRNGQISGVAAVYNRHSYLPEKRRALEAWGKKKKKKKKKRPLIKVGRAAGSVERCRC